MIRYQVLDRQRLPCRNVDNERFAGVITDLIAPVNEEAAPRPQAYLVEQNPNWTLRPHFHLEHQFQVFIAGDGFVGKHALEQLMVHYAAPHTAYGPIVAGDKGLSYFTLRAVGDVGAWYMPEARPHLQMHARKKVAHSAPSARFSPDEVRQLAEPVTEVLLEPDPDGLAAWICRLPPRGGMAAPESPFDGGGRFYVVTQGSMLAGGAELDGIAALFASREETVELRAGANGLEVLVLQFPKAAEHSFADNTAGRASERPN